jgi:hypothetical protein
MFLSIGRPWRASRLPLLVVVLATAAVVTHETYPRRAPPCSVGQLVDRVLQQGMDWRVVPAMQSNPDLEGGAFLCERDRRWEELCGLGRIASRQAEWAGVVHAHRWPCNEDTTAFILREWQSCSARVGDVLLFGDPAMLRRIVEALEQ